MKSPAYAAMTPRSIEALKMLGKRLKKARLRRNESQAMIAKRTCTTRGTQQRLENGHPGVTLGVLLNTLYVYGLLDDFKEIANSDKDVVGKALEANRLPKRARHKKNEEFNSDF